jgi:hypothetical protein
MGFLVLCLPRNPQSAQTCASLLSNEYIESACALYFPSVQKVATLMCVLFRYSQNILSQVCVLVWLALLLESSDLSMGKYLTHSLLISIKDIM